MMYRVQTAFCFPIFKCDWIHFCHFYKRENLSATPSGKNLVQTEKELNLSFLNRSTTEENIIGQIACPSSVSIRHNFLAMYMWTWQTCRLKIHLLNNGPLTITQVIAAAHKDEKHLKFKDTLSYTWTDTYSNCLVFELKNNNWNKFIFMILIIFLVVVVVNNEGTDDDIGVKSFNLKINVRLNAFAYIC